VAEVAVLHQEVLREVLHQVVGPVDFRLAGLLGDLVGREAAYQGRRDHRQVLTDPAVALLAFPGVPSLAGFSDPLSHDTGGGVGGELGRRLQVVPTTALATVLKILLVRRARNLGRLEEVFPNGNRFVGLVGVCWRVTVIKPVRGSGRPLSAQRPAAQSLAHPQPENF
jgi:hypothetical protein